MRAAGDRGRSRRTHGDRTRHPRSRPTPRPEDAPSPPRSSRRAASRSASCIVLNPDTRKASRRAGARRAGGDRHLAVGAIVGDDHAVRRRCHDLTIGERDDGPRGVLHDQVRVEGVRRGGAHPVDDRRHEPSHVVVDAHEMLGARDAEVRQRDSRAHTRPAQRHRRVETRREGVEQVGGGGEPLPRRRVRADRGSRR
jgi:hypothetical protein